MLAWCIIRLPCVKGAPPQAVRDCLLFETGDTKRKSVLTVWVALLQRFCKAQTDTPLFFDTKGAKKSSQKKRRVPAGTKGRFFAKKLRKKTFCTWRVRTHLSHSEKPRLNTEVFLVWQDKL